MNDYILIKLRSGEEIVGKIVGKNRSGIRISRPMLIKQLPFIDHVRGNVKAVTVMENWIGRTDDNEVVIPNTMIGIRLIPSQDVVKGYLRYLESEDVPTQPKAEESAKLPVQMNDQKNEMLKDFEDELERMLKEMSSAAGMTNIPMNDASNFFSSLSSDVDKSKEKDMVIINFMIPSKVFKAMAEEGLIEDIINSGMDGDGDEDDEDLEDDVAPKKKVKDDRGQIKESGDESFGNSFKDWSPDPKDYL